MYLLIGPFVAVVGLVAVFFVMRHRSVQTKSMYSSRRQQIERKVRAARQRTLTPSGKQPEGAGAPAQEFIAPGMEGKTAIPTATWGPPAAGPAVAPPPPPPPSEQVWEIGPTVPPPPSVPPPAPEPPYTPAPAEQVWTPAPMEPVAPPPPEPMPSPLEPQVTTPAGGGAAWSIVGETKAGAEEPVADKKGKKDRRSSWQLASGEAPGDDSGEEVKGPSSAIAVAQYAVLVVGLVMVLIGVLVMVANAHVT
jgi:uncharacterized integral membrane protein